MTDNDEGKSKALLKVFDRAVEHQWDKAVVLLASHRRRNPDASNQAIVDRIIRDFVRDMTVVGGLGGAATAVPGPQVVARVAVGMTLETGILLERAALMILAVASAYGHDLDDIQIRRFAILRVLGAWAGVTDGVTGVAASMGAGLGEKAAKAIPMPAVHAFNRKMGKPIIYKWASKSGSVRLGSVLPFGVGLGLGAGGNYLMAQGLARGARNEFRPI